MDIVVGIASVLVGLALVLRGQWALRLLLALWGAFVGVAAGAGLVAWIGGDGFLTTAIGWIVGVVVGIAFAMVAYFYYAISIVVGMAGMGFVLGGTIASGVGIDHPWVAAIIGIVLGALLAVWAVLADIPQILLVVLSSLAGASIAIAGLMLIFGVSDTDEIVGGEASYGDHPIWYMAFVALALFGMIVQMREVATMRASVRQAWARESAARVGHRH